MASTIHKVAKCPDTIILLHDPGSNLIAQTHEVDWKRGSKKAATDWPWAASVVAPGPDDDEASGIGLSKSRKKKKPKKKKELQREAQEIERSNITTEAAESLAPIGFEIESTATDPVNPQHFDRGPSAPQSLSFNVISGTKDRELLQEEDRASPRSEPEPIEFHVSSAHLREASKQFRTMLTGEKWIESHIHPDGLHRVDVRGWNEDIFLLIMNIIHGRYRSTRLKMNLDELAQLAVLVDYYSFHESVELYVDIWIKNGLEVPTVFCHDLMLWMCVSWVFGLQAQFKAATRIAIRVSAMDTMPMLGLPMNSFISQVEDARREAIGTLIRSLHHLLDSLQDPDYVCQTDQSCSFECGSMLSGALGKEMRRMGILDSYAANSYEGQCLEEMLQKVKLVRNPKWGNPACRVSHGFGHTSAPLQHGCNLSDMIARVAEEASQKAQGLDLKSFGPSETAKD